MLTIEAKPNAHVTVEDADQEDDKTGLPECNLIVQAMDEDDILVSSRVPLNPYQAEAVANALLRWVKDVTIESDEDLDDDEDDAEDDDESELNR